LDLHFLHNDLAMGFDSTLGAAQRAAGLLSGATIKMGIPRQSG
jgi:hypothetical protein